MIERDNDAAWHGDVVDDSAEDGIEMQVREFIEIEKMRNLEISRFDDEVDKIHKSKDRRINDLSEELWHANRRADDLDRRWNELAAAYEQTKADLLNTGRRLDELQAQTSYRLLTKIIHLAKGGPLRAMLAKRRAEPAPAE